LVPVVEVGGDLAIHFGDHFIPHQISAQFERSVRAFGAEGQARLASLTVGIVGLGGIGSLVAEQLAHLGVRRFLLIDPDTIEASNLNRVVGADYGSVGKFKVEVSETMIRRINPTVDVDVLVGNVTMSTDIRRLLKCDFVFCCTDSHGSRAVMNQLAYQFLIPIIDIGVLIQAKSNKIVSISGRIQMLAPGLPCLVCHNLLDPEEVRRDLLSDEERVRDPYIVGAVEPQPSVVSLNGTVASLGVTMMLSAVVGIPVRTRHQVVLFDKGTVRAVTSEQSPDCVVCSLRGTLARGETWAIPGRPS